MNAALRLCLPTLLAACMYTPAAAQDWPRVALPRQAQSFQVAGQLTHNGLPMRLQGFVSELPPGELIDRFREQLGEPLVESRWGRQRILGRMQGAFYLSVQVEPAGQGSRGLVAVTHLKAAGGSDDPAPAQMRDWAARLPSGSRLLSHTASSDGAKHSTHIVFANAHPEDLNAERLRRVLGEDGFTFERQGRAKGGRALFFKRPGGEALATIRQDDTGQTMVVLNLVTPMGAPR